MEIDWLTASQADRQTLYRHAKRIVDRRYGGDWSRFYADIPTHVAPRGHGDQDNFRAGRISRKRAAAIFDWIAVHHPGEAAAISASGTPTPAADWESFVRAHGEEGRLSVALLDDPSLKIVAFVAASREPRIRLGQAFCFAVDSAFEGTALALQGVGGSWYPLPLAEGVLSAPIISGDQLLPFDAAANAPIPLSEAAQLGLHSFVFLAWRGDQDIPPFQIGQPIAPERLHRLARSLVQAERWAAHCLEILFTP